MNENAERIENNFTYHPPKKGQTEKYKALRDQAKSFAYAINALCPDSQEREEAMKNIEACVMWANASIARNE